VHIYEWKKMKLNGFIFFVNRFKIWIYFLWFSK
jgi:hypothetical protein